jgi:uncharacterized protein with PIN domain
MVRLIFDEMLRRTATWCRIFGVDSRYVKDIPDNEIIKIARDEKRILVTRDEELAKLSKSGGIRVLLLKNDKLEDQLNQLKSEFGDIFTFPEKTRCPACNGELEIVDKEEVKEEIPENVYKKNDKFWLCKECKKVYWEGSHWKNITRIFKNIK